MVRRTRDIQKKIWLTPQEERTIAKKMEMIGTENFGAYARKMLIDGYIIVVDYTEQKKLAAEINKIGVNILAGFLIIQAIGIVVGTCFRGVVKVDCLLAQHLADFLEGRFLLAAKKKCAVTVARDGVSRILVDGLELRLGLQDD